MRRIGYVIVKELHQTNVTLPNDFPKSAYLTKPNLTSAEIMYLPIV